MTSRDPTSTVPMGDSGCLSLFGRRPADYELFAEHLTSEPRVTGEARGCRVGMGRQGLLDAADGG